MNRPSLLNYLAFAGFLLMFVVVYAAVRATP
jgi:hypothetical protein